MRVLVVHNHYQQPGGEDVVFAAEKKLLRDKGYEVFEYVDYNKRISKMRRITVARNTIWSSESRKRLLQFLQKIKPDIIHFHNTFLLISPSVYYACRDIGIPVLQSLHNYRIYCPNAAFYRQGQICEDCLKKKVPWPGIIHRCYHGSHSQTAILSVMISLYHFLKTWQKKVDIYIALSEFSREKFIEGGLPREKIFIKPNFIHPDPGMRENNNGLYTLFVGRLSLEKGLLTLLKSWKYLMEIPLKIVGNGPLLKELQIFVYKNKLKCVEFLGHCGYDDLITLIKKARLLIFPSECYETFGRVIVESFACGVPVIASRLGVMEEIVKNAHTGFLFYPGDHENLAEKTEWAWMHPERMREMGKEARREYETKYTRERNFQILKKIYERAINIAKL